jgi:cytochrome P450
MSPPELQRPQDGIPEVLVDPFCREFLLNPERYYAGLQTPGPVIWLSSYQVRAMARWPEVSAALQDWQTFSSAAGVGLEDFRKTKPWRPSSLLLEVDPPIHTRTRRVMSRILSKMALEALRAEWTLKADALVDKLTKSGTFDAIGDLAAAFPLQVFPDAVGLPTAGRENLLPFGNMVFNSFGPRNDIFYESVRRAEQVVTWIMDQCRREVLRPGGFGSQVFEGVDRGELTAQEAPVLVRSMLTAGLDTTVSALGSALYAFALFPDQYQILRDDPTRVRASFDEVVRWASPVQTFFRTTTRSVSIAGVTIPGDAKVLLFLGAANRDPERWPDPHRFDITRKTLGHVGFGSGIHGCVGQMVARLEVEVVLHALIRRVASIKIVGEPRRHPNNTLRALSSLPVCVMAA